MRRDLPFLTVACLIHGVILAVNPAIEWGAMVAPAAEKLLPVEFVAAPPPSPLLAPIPPGYGKKEDIPGNGPGPFVPEKIKKTTPKPKRAARPRPALTPEQKAALKQKRAEAKRRAAVIKAAREEAAAQALAQARQEALRRAAEKRERDIRLAAERAEKVLRKAELSRELASLSNPDEALQAAPAETAEPVGIKHGNGKADAMPDSGDPVYELEREGRDAVNQRMSGGGRYSEGGIGWSIDGPVGSRRLLRRSLPKSPDWVSSRGLDLAVQIKFAVLPDGTVKPGAVVKKTSGFPEIDRRALQAIKLWRFEAIPPNQNAPEVWGSVTFHFTMG